MELLRDLKVISRVSLGGGCINQAERISTADGRDYFLKTHPSPPKGFFRAEAHGLELLRKRAKSLIIPEVLQVSEQGLLLEFLEPGAEASKALARGLAELHEADANSFGLDSDNFIGLTEQPNVLSNNWPEFFCEQRLRFQAELGKRKGWFNDSEVFESYLTRAHSVLSEGRIQPSLIHGDLWSGNVYWSSKGPALIDPAVYFGDSEADLAFSEMFGGFSTEFYETYFSTRASSKNYAQKKKIYNFYHLINHANIFGGSYCSQVSHQLRSFRL